MNPDYVQRISLGPVIRLGKRPSGSLGRIDGIGEGKQVLKLNDVIPITKNFSLEKRKNFLEWVLKLVEI